jgi:hypothetical protein
MHPILWANWIEALTGFEPDQNDGTVEWLIAIAVLATAPYWSSWRARMGTGRGQRLSSLD